MGIGAMKRVVEAFDALPPDHPARYANLQINLLRTAIQQATQPAEVTDEQILKTLRPDVWMHVEGLYREQMLADARAILALRPVQVPMTDEQVDAFTVNGRLHWLGKRQLIRAVEAYYGITAQAKKETP